MQRMAPPVITAMSGNFPFQAPKTARAVPSNKAKRQRPTKSPISLERPSVDSAKVLVHCDIETSVAAPTAMPRMTRMK